MQLKSVKTLVTSSEDDSPSPSLNIRTSHAFLWIPKGCALLLACRAWPRWHRVGVLSHEELLSPALWLVLRTTSCLSFCQPAETEKERLTG
ncbi:hypothetical protein SRHO_G00205170 [Serrasalmus rhombeus]